MQPTHDQVDALIDRAPALKEVAPLAADLSDLGGMVWRGRILGHLVSRLRVEDWIARHPELVTRAVPAPIFVVGLPRTGTTALSHLLAQDPDTRSLRVWEAADPAPPPDVSCDGFNPQ